VLKKASERKGENASAFVWSGRDQQISQLQTRHNTRPHLWQHFTVKCTRQQLCGGYIGIMRNSMLVDPHGPRPIIPSHHLLSPTVVIRPSVHNFWNFLSPKWPTNFLLNYRVFQAHQKKKFGGHRHLVTWSDYYSS
jgi:hypothetical protein